MKKIIITLLLLGTVFNVTAGDDVRYDQKRRLLCEVTSLHPVFSDFFVGDLRDGWLRIQDNSFYSIEIGGWVVMRYSQNDGDTVVDNTKQLIIRDYIGMAKINKRTGKVTMSIDRKSVV